MQHNVYNHADNVKSVDSQLFWNVTIMNKPIDEYMEWARKLNQDILGKHWKVSRKVKRKNND